MTALLKTRCISCGRLCFERLTIPARTKTGLVARVCNVTCRDSLSGDKRIVVKRLDPIFTPEQISGQLVRWTGKNRRPR